MDDEFTAGFSEPCPRCSEVSWGVSEEGQFFCRNCHSIIERTREVVDLSFTQGSNRVSTISKGPRNKTEGGRLWMVCEGFQFILKNQAEALVELGVDQRFKDEVLCRLWRLYLQKTHQAYTVTPVRSCSFSLKGPGSGPGSDSESALDSVVSSCDSDGGNYPPSSAGSVMSIGSVGERSDWSVCSGSVDSESYLSQNKKRSSRGLMSMRKTLALLHVALVWSRQHLALSDLLRLVEEGHVPYVNSYQRFPEEMKLSNRDALVFRVQSVPSYASVHRESRELMAFLQLPAFPPISSQSSLHPLTLSLRYMVELNLPDEMSEWVESLLGRVDLMNPSRLTFDPVTHPKLPRYDLLAAAAIIVCMKFLFGLDDQTEWELSSDASSIESGQVFSLRRWFRLLQPALLRSQERRVQLKARKQWVPKKPFYFTHKQKSVAMKRRRVAEQLSTCFERLSSRRHSDTERGGPCSFHFLWGRSPDADGPSLHHMTLEGGARTNPTDHVIEEAYWHTALRRCRTCRNHYSSVEPDLPRMFVWVLDLFSFVLNISSSVLFEEVLSVERSVLGSRLPRAAGRRRKPRRKPRMEPRTEPRRKTTETGQTEHSD